MHQESQSGVIYGDILIFPLSQPLTGWDEPYHPDM